MLLEKQNEYHRTTGLIRKSDRRQTRVDTTILRKHHTASEYIKADRSALGLEKLGLISDTLFSFGCCSFRQRYLVLDELQISPKQSLLELYHLFACEVNFIVHKSIS